MSTITGPSWSVDNPRALKHQRAESPASPHSSSTSSPRRHPYPRSNTASRSPKRSRAKISGGDAHVDPSTWRYHLEVIQQPQRARACGFGDKDRRPLSPPPIVRLWVRTQSGQLVDPNIVNIHFLILTVDLWSADGSAERNIVMHPSAQGSRAMSEAPDQPTISSRPSTAASRPLSSYETPSFGRWHKAEHQPSFYPSNYHLMEVRDDHGRPPYPPSHAYWDRPAAVSRTQSFELDRRDIDPRTPRPATAPSSHAPPKFHLPPLSTISEHTPRESHPPLPIPHERPASSPSTHHRVSWSGREPLDSESRPMSSWSERPRTMASSRPSTAGPLLSPRSAPYASSESSYGGMPRTPEAPKLHFANSGPMFTRVLVGSLTSVCMRLQDEEGNPGLYFFAHDLGIRTEGVFTLRFTLVDLASLMTSRALGGESSKALAEIYSDRFTVYSAKRFPGVIPTTDLTRHFAGQNVRLPTRQRRTREDSHSDGDDE